MVNCRSRPASLEVFNFSAGTFHLIGSRRNYLGARPRPAAELLGQLGLNEALGSNLDSTSHRLKQMIADVPLALALTQ